MYFPFHQSHDHRCESQGTISPSCPSLPSASPFQLQFNRYYSLPVNPPPLPPPAQPIQPPPDYSLQEAASSQLARTTENATPSTPPPLSSIRSLTTPPPFQQQTQLDSTGVTLQRPGIFSMQQPPEPVLRPQAIPNPQFVQISGRRAPCSRFIVKIGLVGSSLGRIVSKYKIPGSYWNELTFRECYGIIYTSISK